MASLYSTFFKFEELFIYLYCNEVEVHFVLVSPQLKLKCRRKGRAPSEMEGGSATSDRRFAYFLPHGTHSIFKYEWSTGKWLDKPLLCPYHNSGLAIVDGELTSVGGKRGALCKKSIKTRREKWVNEYPMMNTARASPAVVSTSDGGYLVVMGGQIDNGHWSHKVELMEVEEKTWYKLKSLPEALPYPSSTIIRDNKLIVLGHRSIGLSCSLALDSVPPTLRWRPLPSLPVTAATPVQLQEELVIVGGKQSGMPYDSIHQLIDREWIEISSMNSVRERALVVIPSPDKIMIVGGVGAGDSVEECAIVKSKEDSTTNAEGNTASKR